MTGIQVAICDGQLEVVKYLISLPRACEMLSPEQLGKYLRIVSK